MRSPAGNIIYSGVRAMVQEESLNDPSQELAPKKRRRVAARLTDSDRHTLDMVKELGGAVNVDINGRPISEWDSAGKIDYRIQRLVTLGMMERQEQVLAPGLPAIVHYRLLNH
jgi:hypothetical protein